MTKDHKPRTYSLSLDVEGFLRHESFPEAYENFLENEGTPLSPSEAMAFLVIERAKGRKCIPCSAECGNPCQHSDNGCTGFDYAGGGCPGRYSDPDHPASDDGGTQTTHS